ncbi:MAG: hypothetical protein M2R45_01944 [Verrucomicrobia subdivision 3 bacterium]|nr:hypothetical protein [Limisphaerales bacterium]MCS1416190.1 hypothetical protein [Limisphaerales bacterium]
MSVAHVEFVFRRRLLRYGAQTLFPDQGVRSSVYPSLFAEIIVGA